MSSPLDSLTEATTVSDSDQFYAVSGGNDRKVLASTLRREFSGYATVKDMLTDASFSASEGDIVEAGGYRYVVKAASATDHAITTLSGVKIAPVERDWLSPKMLGAIGDDASHPLSGWFATLADAQTVFPEAVALTDEIDWAAYQRLAEYLYDRDFDPAVVPEANWSAGSIKHDGQFVVNRTVTISAYSVHILGVASSAYGKGSCSSIRYNGPDGTIDAPIWIMDLYVADEFGNPPPGKVIYSAQSGGLRAIVEGVAFLGKNGNHNGPNGDESGYISGLRLRKASLSKVARCVFDRCLWDGMNVTDGQLFLIIEHNYFVRCYRDGLAVHRVYAGFGFSTTTWIHHNEFAIIGRYFLLMDTRGSIGPDIRIRDNSFEAGLDGYFTNRPDWWLGGVVSPVCMIGLKYSNFDGNRFEGITFYYPDLYLCDMHIMDGVRPRLQNQNCTTIAFSSRRSTNDETTALDTHKNIVGYSDFTDARSLHLAEDGNSRSGVREVHMSSCLDTTIYNIDGRGLNAGALHSISDTDVQWWETDTEAGTYVKRLKPRNNIVMRLGQLIPVVYTNAQSLDRYGGRRYISGHAASGNFFPMPDTLVASEWAALTAHDASASAAFSKNLIRPTVYNGWVYQAQNSGTTGSTEPAWPTSLGATVIDGDITWECISRVADGDDVGNGAQRAVQTMNLSDKIMWQDANAPTSGYHAQGEIVFRRLPTASGTIGWVCVTAGIPGTWKEFGSIEA